MPEHLFGFFKSNIFISTKLKIWRSVARSAVPLHRRSTYLGYTGGLNSHACRLLSTIILCLNLYNLLATPLAQGTKRKAVAREGGGCMCTPPPFLKKNKTKKEQKKPKNYFLCRIIRFYTNNPKCKYVYLFKWLPDHTQSWKRIYI